MALDATQLEPVTMLGPDGSDRPDPTTLPLGYAYKPRGVPRIDIVELSGGVHVWGSTAGVSPISLLTNPVFYIDPVNGSDSNPGTITQPFLTFDHAEQALAPGYFGFATLNLRAGSLVIGSKTVFPAPLSNSNTTAGGLLINGVDNTASSLGNRTASGGTTGNTTTSSVFGTVVDSVAGLTVNAWRGWFIRFTSGATLNGRSFQIASNTSSTFTVTGNLPVAPTTETYVVERPAAIITWAGTEVMQGSGPVGFQNVGFVGAGGSNGLILGGFIAGLQRCTMESLGSAGLQIRNNAGLTDLTAIQHFFGTTSITQQCGSYFHGFEIPYRIGSTSGLGPAGLNLTRTVFHDCDTEHVNGTLIQYRSCYFTGNSWVRMAYGSTALIASCRFDTVTPAPFTAVVAGSLGAAIVFAKRSSGVVSLTDISNTPATTAPGDAIAIQDLSTAIVTDAVGTGNAGLGCRVNRLSQVQRNTGTTVTGTAGEVQIGANAPTTWNAGLATLNTDPVELCLGGPSI